LKQQFEEEYAAVHNGFAPELPTSKSFDMRSRISTGDPFYLIYQLWSLIRRVLLIERERFVAQWRVKPGRTEEVAKLIPQEVLAVKKLWRTGKVQQHWMAADRSTGWLVVRAESLAGAKLILGQLPLSCHLEFSVSEAVREI
jgi:hypothetical protein